MKRGLVKLDPAEIAPADLEGRVEALRRVLSGKGLAMGLVYGDVYHSGDITYLSNICLYWNEAVLAVPVSDRPALLMKLSRRVHPWMRATSNLEDLRSGTSLASLVADYLGGSPSSVGGVGLVEQAWWPAPLVAQLDGGEGRGVSDLGGVVRRARRIPSEAELELLRAGARVTSEALQAGLDAGPGEWERTAAAERAARRSGVEDALVRCSDSGRGVVTMKVVTEYRGYWTTAARILVTDHSPWVEELKLAYRAGAIALRAGTSLPDARAVVADALGSSFVSWRVDLLHHTDLETEGGYRLSGEDAQALERGSVVALVLEVLLSDGSQAAVADTYEILSNGATRLTSGPPGAVVD